MMYDTILYSGLPDVSKAVQGEKGERGEKVMIR